SRASRPRMEAGSSIGWLVVRARPRARSSSWAPMRSSTAQPPGPGLPRQAPSVNISTVGRSVTSGNEFARQLEDHPLRGMIGLLFGHREALVKRVHDLANEQLGR